MDEYFRGDLLHFSTLPCRNRSLRGALTLGYRLTDDWDDPWTQRFNGFKSARPNDVECACRALSAALGRLDEVTTCPPHQVLAVCAIPSRELSIPREHPVYRLAQRVSAQMGWQFLPELLSKRRHTPLHEIRQGAHARDAAVRGAYRCDPTIGSIGVTHVAIFDDFITRGSTMEECARAVRAQFRATVFGIALGKSARLEYEPDASNKHLAEYAAMWPCGGGRSALATTPGTTCKDKLVRLAQLAPIQLLQRHFSGRRA